MHVKVLWRKETIYPSLFSTKDWNTNAPRSPPLHLPKIFNHFYVNKKNLMLKSCTIHISAMISERESPFQRLQIDVPPYLLLQTYVVQYSTLSQHKHSRVYTVYQYTKHTPTLKPLKRRRVRFSQAMSSLYFGPWPTRILIKKKI